MKNQNAKTKAKPAFEVRLNHIRATVWENTSGDKRPWFNTTINRRYQDGDDWKDATTYNGLADLTLVIEAVKMCKEFIKHSEYERGAFTSEGHE